MERSSKREPWKFMFVFLWAFFLLNVGCEVGRVVYVTRHPSGSPTPIGMLRITDQVAGMTGGAIGFVLGLLSSIPLLKIFRKSNKNASGVGLVPLEMQPKISEEALQPTEPERRQSGKRFDEEEKGGED